MKDVTLVNGEKMTDPEWVERFGMGDTLTDFIPTKEDLQSLMYGIVDDLLAAELYLQICVSRRDIDRYHYIDNRLSRLLDHSPELAEGIDGARERLRRGREENKERLAERENERRTR
jgi:hypothetical protein